MCTPWSTANSVVSISAIGSERVPRVVPSVATSTIQTAVPIAVVTSRTRPSGLSAARIAEPAARARGETWSAGAVGGAASTVPASAPMSAHRSP